MPITISKSYVNRHIQMYELCTMYPGLKELKLSFTELFKCRNKLSSIFAKYPEQAKEWM